MGRRSSIKEKKGKEGRSYKLNVLNSNNHKLGPLSKQLFYAPRVHFVFRVLNTLNTLSVNIKLVSCFGFEMGNQTVFQEAVVFQGYLLK